MGEKGLSAREKLFVEARMGGANLTDAAAAAHVSYRQARRYSCDPRIKAALKAALDDLFAQATRRIAGNLTTAVNVLAEIAQGGEGETARVAASRALLENGQRFVETHDLTARVGDLERLIGGDSDESAD